MTQSHHPFNLYIWTSKNQRERVKEKGLSLEAPFHEYDSEGRRCIQANSCPVQAWGLDTSSLSLGITWDLWMVSSIHVPNWRKEERHKGEHPAPFLLYDAIKPEHLHYIGTRSDEE